MGEQGEIDKEGEMKRITAPLFHELKVYNIIVFYISKDP